MFCRLKTRMDRLVSVLANRQYSLTFRELEICFGFQLIYLDLILKLSKNLKTLNIQFVLKYSFPYVLVVLMGICNTCTFGKKESNTK